MSVKPETRRLYRAGLFGRVAQVLSNRTNLSEDETILLAEAFNILGLVDESKTLTAKLLAEGKIEPLHASKCNGLLADQYWHAGRFDCALELYHKAVALAEKADNLPQLCRSVLQLLERTTDRSGFDSSLPLANRARHYVVRCGDPQISTLIHLIFGRLEARAGHLDTSRKHFDLARKLLATDRNAWLAASIDLDESGVLALGGDFLGAVDLCRSGAAAAVESGWSQGKVASAANLAFFYVSLGRPREANEQLGLATKEPFRSPSYDLALADTQARAELAAGHFE
jgi:tetratricopeptide (TPR) repeat protein